MSDLTLVLLRHFPSIWNNPLERRFTGWEDIDLAVGAYARGVELGHKLKRQGFEFDVCFTSTLRRATASLAAVLTAYHDDSLKVVQSADLNERHYGTLQGMLHTEAIAKYGAEQVHAWRRTFTGRPPNGESLADTCERVLPYWNETIRPNLIHGKRVLILAHGNSLRALYMQLAGLSPDAIEQFEIPTSVPLVCTLDAIDLSLKSSYFLST